MSFWGGVWGQTIKSWGAEGEEKVFKIECLHCKASIISRILLSFSFLVGCLLQKNLQMPVIFSANWGWGGVKIMQKHWMISDKLWNLYDIAHNTSRKITPLQVGYYSHVLNVPTLVGYWELEKLLERILKCHRCPSSEHQSHKHCNGGKNPNQPKKLRTKQINKTSNQGARLK